jgi:malonate transporter and related proteins
MNALINVVIPVFGIILTGYLAGRFGVLGPESAAALNRFVYYFAIPAATFIFAARAPIDRIFNWPFIGAYVSGSLLTLLIALIVGRLWFRHDTATLSVAGVTSVFGQVIGIGLPLLLTAYGPDGALPPIVAALIYVVLFLTSIIAVLEAARTLELSPLRMAAQLVGTLLRNPVVISPLLGVLYSMTALPLPKAVSNYLDLMAAAVGPAALFAVGLSLVGRKLTTNAGEVIWLSALKTVVNPILTFVLVTYVFVMDPFWSQAAVILSAMPVGTNPYVVAQQYDVHIETVSPTIVVSTAMSVVTIFFALIWFGVG